MRRPFGVSLRIASGPASGPDDGESDVYPIAASAHSAWSSGVASTSCLVGVPKVDQIAHHESKSFDMDE